jgi:hypothetical protein
VARSLAVAATLAALTAVALPVFGGYGYLDRLMTTPEVVVAVSFSGTGALLVGSVEARRIGWLLLLVGVLSATYVLSTSWTAFVLEGDASAPLPVGADLARLTAWVSGWAWLPGWLLVCTVLVQVVPAGLPLPGAWRLLHVVSWVAVGLAVLTFAAAPGEVGPFTGVENPFAVEALNSLLSPGLPAMNLARADR